MKMIMDESSSDLTRLLGELRVMTPQVLGCSERRLILPRKLGDLERPECLQDMKDRIQKLKLAKDMLDTGLIIQAEYDSKKAEILSRG
ncbi:MAG: hypothetical protein NTV25_06785 [Methanothrix sp.]|nr:hypothetical protein [Methanothrix sp.]